MILVGHSLLLINLFLHLHICCFYETSHLNTGLFFAAYANANFNLQFINEYFIIDFKEYFFFSIEFSLFISQYC